MSHEDANPPHQCDASDDDTFDLPADTQPTPSAFDPKALTAALMSADTDVDMPSRGHAGSVISNLISLGTGECYTKSVEVDRALTMEAMQDSINAWKHKLRQSVNQSVRHAKKYDGRELSIETTQTVTANGRMFIQAIVTRTA